MSLRLHEKRQQDDHRRVRLFDRRGQLRQLYFASLLVLAVLCARPDAYAAKQPPPDHWVSTWATANYARPNADHSIGAADRTYREIVRTTLGGDLVRIELSNEFGTEPLSIGEVHVALSDAGTGKNTDIDLLSANALTFSGQTAVTIPAGGTAVSDPFALKLPAETDLAISLYLPAQTISTVSFHGSALATNYTAPGNVVRKVSLAAPAFDAKAMTSWYFLKQVEVETPATTGAIVAFGDSITDGARSTVDAHAAWPAVLGRRLQADPATRDLAVVNEGIGGNRILHDGTGPDALERFDRDVLAIAGARGVILMEGINDIGHATDPAAPYDIVSADDLIGGLSQLADRAHAKGLKVYGATLTPYTGAKYASPAGEQMREQINAWIRSTNKFDGVLDFAKVTADPAKENAFLPAYDSGDHLHPGDAGYKAMGDAVDLKLFGAVPRKAKRK